MTRKANDIDDISVVICAYTERRWDNLLAAVESVRRQTLPPIEIILVIDHNPNLLKRAQNAMQDVIVLENTDARGLRGARNCGVCAAKGQIIAFLDDDAVAVPDWLLHLCEGYSDPQVLGTGGAITPLWSESQPGWFPEEFYWVIGCTYRGMPRKGVTIRNPIGANMSIRRSVFDVVGNFSSDFATIGSIHAGGCEDTELCIRARQNWPQGVFLYQPKACVFHTVHQERTVWHYFCSRCYAEGISKSLLTRKTGMKDSLASECAYTLLMLPRGVVHGLADTVLRGDLTGLSKAGAIISGLAITAIGYIVGSMLLRLPRYNKTVPGRSAIRPIPASVGEQSLTAHKVLR